MLIISTVQHLKRLAAKKRGEPFFYELPISYFRSTRMSPEVVENWKLALPEEYLALPDFPEPVVTGKSEEKLPETLL